MNSRSATHSIIILSLTYILEYLPAYSPDYNPIEHTWAQAKAHRRKTGETAEQISPIKSESKVESSGYMLGKTKVRMGPVTVTESIRQIEGQV